MLILDPGGTRLKFGQSEGGEIISAGSIPWNALLDAGGFDWSREPALEGGSPGDDHHAAWIIDRPAPPAAGSDWQARFLAASKGRLTRLVALDLTSDPGFEIDYDGGFPGADRLAAAVACHRRDPEGSFVIIDAGTCITVDLLSPGRWRGGAILPGIGLQASAMANAGLPILSADAPGIWNIDPGPHGALGTSTQGAIKAGIPWATRHSVESVVRAFLDIDPRAEVVITGGDAPHFAGLGGWRTFADPNLVLRGGALLLNERCP